MNVPNKAIEIVNLGDHNLDPWEAEVRAKNERLVTEAINQLRAQGEPRPVLVIAEADVLNLGEPTAAGPAPGLTSWVVPRRQVLAALPAVLRRVLRDQFQRHVWPVSYYTLAFRLDGVVDSCESQLPSDDEGS